MRDYELMIVLDPNLDEAAIDAMNTRIQSLVTQRGGTVDNVDTWGRKRLAYPIGRFRDGFYILNRLQLPPTAATEIERALKLTESVIRHLLVRSEGLSAAPVAAAAASAARD
ncbi:MAG TPA: 30S ribosomal protein S6 [Chloroflexota bacterium]|nr:30S ribosomal protein S6 [Chloroflexota bacterium]